MPWPVGLQTVGATPVARCGSRCDPNQTIAFVERRCGPAATELQRIAHRSTHTTQARSSQMSGSNAIGGNPFNKNVPSGPSEAPWSNDYAPAN
jgi:hypothetical protein